MGNRDGMDAPLMTIPGHKSPYSMVPGTGREPEARLRRLPQPPDPTRDKEATRPLGAHGSGGELAPRRSSPWPLSANKFDRSFPSEAL